LEDKMYVVQATGMDAVGDKDGQGRLLTEAQK
jgi:hypothetical protein